MYISAAMRRLLSALVLSVSPVSPAIRLNRTIPCRSQTARFHPGAAASHSSIAAATGGAAAIMKIGIFRAASSPACAHTSIRTAEVKRPWRMLCTAAIAASTIMPSKKIAVG